MIPGKPYRITAAVSSFGKDKPVGTVVYKSLKYDYGCASEDTRHTGVEHVSVTEDSDGGYPYFTIPEYALEPLE